ncbi:uncharacterized protein EI97DRAFT_461529 [Westerdykella ornata]|uniref:Uncharacterized protein n=1 Tax=Westerdykella ornata TaxID=318751 RepID=A0A6A6JCJ5_WESOR|nr:uncharacterized protein EI97DRAFT_461529 [Westerdykella ornata]KAF2272909.1 hypothetical protein EI97DRAFT_461529 [Westerdykella ornata]
MPLELGFQANAGPLTQISIQLLSMETAYHLAVSTIGWWKARRKADTLNAILDARMASLAPIATFNMRNYTIMRRKHPMFGVARQPKGALVSVELPAASSSDYGTTGLCCLYALVTALLCFYDQKSVVSILMELLPDHLLHYDQDDVRLSKEPGPLYTAVRAFVVEVAKEEANGKATRTLQRAVDDLRLILGETPRVCYDSLKNSDCREVMAFLEWLAVPYSKRQCHLYPTRSFLVWALAEVLSILGFELHVSKIVITSPEQYLATFERDNNIDEMGIYFVPVSVGRTDPFLAGQISSKEIIPTSTVRIIAIHAIPRMELGQFLMHDSKQMDTLIEAWIFTFNHFQDQSTDKFTVDLSQHQKAALEPFNHKDLEFGLVSLVYQSLKRPVAKFVQATCPDCPPLRRDSFMEEHCSRSCWLEEGRHNEEGRLMLRIIYMAAAYSLACRYVKDTNGRADLNIEVGYEPSKSESIGEFLAMKPTWHDWFMNHYHIFRPYSCDSDELLFKLAYAMCGSPVSRQHSTKPIEYYGCHVNGLTLLSKFPQAPVNSRSPYTFHLRFGQPLDLPVQDNLIISRDKATRLKGKTIQMPPSDPEELLEPDCNDLVRWDVEPDWEDSELDIHYQCRTQGIRKLSVPLPLMKTSLKAMQDTICEHPCQDPISQHAHQLDRNAILARHEQSLSCHIVRYKSIRQQGYSRILLEPRKLLGCVNQKPTVVILETFSDPVEHWLALNTECQATSEIPFPNVRRIISDCLQCGLDAAGRIPRVMLDTVVILVVTPRGCVLSG